VQRRVVRVARDLGLELADGRLLRLLRHSLAPRDRECERNGCQDCIPGDAGPECPCHSPSTTSVTPPPLTVASTAPAARASIVDFMADERSHASPDPREILHVPRSYVV